jgi:hypothetical protein
MKHSEFESVLLTVWEQSLVCNSRNVTLAGETFPVRSVTKHKLKEVYFRFEGHKFRGSEPYPNTESRRAVEVGEGSKVMQFVERGYKVAVVRDGKVFNLLKMLAEHD